MIKAIPTTYRGTLFRSRLEARWAAFFDVLNWPWAYEPFDLDGWIPDFVLGANLDSGICCEVKPIDFTGHDETGLNVCWQPYRDQIDRAQRATTLRGGFVLLGMRPFWKKCWDTELESFDFASLGLSFWPAFDKFAWTEALSRRDIDGQLDFVIEREPYRGAVTGHIFDHARDDIDEFVFINSCIAPLWNRAGNAVQYRASANA